MDQATEQSNFDDTASIEEALSDYLEPEVSEEEEAEDLDGNEPEPEEEDGVDEPESDDEIQEEDEDAEEEEEAEQDTFTVVIDGEDVAVSRDELLNGYQRQADYTRKTQELANQRKQADEAFAEKQQAIEAQAQQMGVLAQQLQQMTEADQNINWDQLMDEDPAMYIRMKEQANQRQQALLQASQQQQYLQQQAQQEQEAKQQEFASKQYEQLLTEWPEWKDPSTASANKQAISTYLSVNGFTPDEIGQLADFRTLKLVEKARKYDELQAGKPAVKKRVNKAPKVIKPQAGRTKANANNDVRAKQLKRLKQSGSKDDAALLLQDF